MNIAFKKKYPIGEKFVFRHPFSKKHCRCVVEKYSGGNLVWMRGRFGYSKNQLFLMDVNDLLPNDYIGTLPKQDKE